jgi:proline dehydrogenase
VSAAARLIARILPAIPRPVVHSLTTPYLAGTTLADALSVIRKLNMSGAMATVDVLGEQFTSPGQVQELVSEYTNVLREIDRAGLNSNLSVKMTGLGLRLDPAACQKNLEFLVSEAAALGNFVRIDMEDSTTTSATLKAYRALRGAGLENVGIVLQAYLRRTPGDIQDLAALRPNVRLCKGIWVERPAVAYHDREAIRASFVRCLDRLFAIGSYVGVASHDEWIHCETLRLADKHGLKAEDYEFQMLLGVREDLRTALVAQGCQLRVYVPFGVHWYEYALRRVQENPAIVGYVASDTVNRTVKRASRALRPKGGGRSGSRPHGDGERP